MFLLRSTTTRCVNERTNAGQSCIEYAIDRNAEYVSLCSFSVAFFFSPLPLPLPPTRCPRRSCAIRQANCDNDRQLSGGFEEREEVKRGGRGKSETFNALLRGFSVTVTLQRRDKTMGKSVAQMRNRVARAIKSHGSSPAHNRQYPEIELFIASHR